MLRNTSWRFRLPVVLLLIGAFETARAKTTIVPLESIFVADRPEASERFLVKRHGAELVEIRQSLNATAGGSASAPLAFVVSHKAPSTAIASAHEVLVSGEKPANSVESSEPSALVFYARTSSLVVAIDKVAIGDGLIRIEYRAEPQLTREVQQYLAFIPLPPLDAGDWTVDTLILPVREQRWPGVSTADFRKLVRQLVSNGFEFKVTKPPE